MVKQTLIPSLIFSSTHVRFFLRVGATSFIISFAVVSFSIIPFSPSSFKYWEQRLELPINPSFSLFNHIPFCTFDKLRRWSVDAYSSEAVIMIHHPFSQFVHRTGDLELPKDWKTKNHRTLKSWEYLSRNPRKRSTFLSNYSILSVNDRIENSSTC